MANREHFRSELVRAARPNPVRSLLSTVLLEGTIKFSGGFPNETLMPIFWTEQIHREIVSNSCLSRKVHQYGPTEGLPSFREASAAYLARQEGRRISPDLIRPLPGSQLGLFNTALCLANPGDTVIVGAPTYLGAINAFALARLNMVPIELDRQGIDVNRIENLLRKGIRIRFVYVIPDFQNPSGITLSLERRQRLLCLAHQYNFLIVEDIPYRRLRFQGEAIPSIWSMDGEGERVILLYTTSKIVYCMRLAICTGPTSFIEDLTKVLAGQLLCVWGYTQELWARIAASNWLDEHIAFLNSQYKARKDALVTVLSEGLSDRQGVSWTDPDGGLFVWLTLPDRTVSGQPVDTEAMNELGKTGGYRVVFVPGHAFYSDGSGRSKARLNFSHPTEEEIRSGGLRLSALIRDTLDR